MKITVIDQGGLPYQLVQHPSKTGHYTAIPF